MDMLFWLGTFGFDGGLLHTRFVFSILSFFRPLLPSLFLFLLLPKFGLLTFFSALFFKLLL
jgi:hypothetical protein